MKHQHRVPAVPFDENPAVELLTKQMNAMAEVLDTMRLTLRQLVAEQVQSEAAVPEPVVHDQGPHGPWAIASAAKHLGVSTRTLTNAEKGGRLRLIRIGTRVMVPDDEVQRVARDGLKGRSVGHRE